MIKLHIYAPLVCLLLFGAVFALTCSNYNLVFKDCSYQSNLVVLIVKTYNTDDEFIIPDSIVIDMAFLVKTKTLFDLLEFACPVHFAALLTSLYADIFVTSEEQNVHIWNLYIIENGDNLKYFISVQYV